MKKFQPDYDSDLSDEISKITKKSFKGIKGELDTVFEKPVKSSIKNPENSFMIFSKEHREVVKEQNPDAKFPDISKLLGQLWKDCPEEEKKKYEEKATEDKKRYMEDVENMENGEEKKKLMKKVEKMKGTKKSSGGQSPGRGKSSWINFCANNRANVQKENKGMKPGDVTKKLSEMWKEMSQEEKDTYKISDDKKEEKVKKIKKEDNQENDRVKELGKLKVSELKDLAKEMQLTFAGKIKKDDLIDLIYKKEQENKKDDEFEEKDDEKEDPSYDDDATQEFEEDDE